MEYIRLKRWPEGVKCIFCGSDVWRNGISEKGARKYQCKKCKKYFNDLSKTIFQNHKFKIEEMFYMIKEMESKTTYQISQELGRDYDAVLNFIHKIILHQSMLKG